MQRNERTNMSKTYTLATDSGTTTVTAASLREALGKTPGIPKHVDTAHRWVFWMMAIGGYGTLTEDGVVLARVSA